MGISDYNSQHYKTTGQIWKFAKYKNYGKNGKNITKV